MPVFLIIFFGILCAHIGNLCFEVLLNYMIFVTFDLLIFKGEDSVKASRAFITICGVSKKAAEWRFI